MSTDSQRTPTSPITGNTSNAPETSSFLNGIGASIDSIVPTSLKKAFDGEVRNEEEELKFAGLSSRIGSLTDEEQKEYDRLNVMLPYKPKSDGSQSSGGNRRNRRRSQRQRQYGGSKGRRSRSRSGSRRRRNRKSRKGGRK